MTRHDSSLFGMSDSSWWDPLRGPTTAQRCAGRCFVGAHRAVSSLLQTALRLPRTRQLPLESYSLDGYPRGICGHGDQVGLLFLSLRINIAVPLHLLWRFLDDGHGQ